MYHNQYWVAMLLMVLSVLNIIGFSVLLGSGELKEMFRKMVQGLLLVWTVAFFVALATIVPPPDVQYSSTIAPAEDAKILPAPTELPPVATAAVVPVEPQAGADMPFGGVLIKNPSKQFFSVMVLDPETGGYDELLIVNSYGEEVLKTRDVECPLEAENEETSFEGYVLVYEEKYPFSFDSKIDGKLVKVINIP